TIATGDFMNRERIVWLCSLLLLTVAALWNPTSAQRDSDYLFVRTLVDVNRMVVGNYVEKVDPGKLEQAAIDGMLNQLDPFTNYVPPARREEFDRMLDGTFKGVGVQLNQLPNGQIEVVSPIDGSPAFKAGINAGDIILKVNNESMEGARLPDVMKRITGELGSEVSLTVRRATGQELVLKMKRDEIVLPTIKGYTRNDDNTWNYYVSRNPKIAYIRLTQFTANTCDTLHSALTDLLKDGMTGLILDLRWNPGGSLDQAVQVVDMLVSSGVIVRTRGLHRPEDVKVATGAGTLPHFPMIVLVNEHSASASEIVAGSLMDNKRAVVLGTRSYGKGSVQELMPLEGNNGELKLTVAYYYLPSGRLVHRKKGAEDWGVEPQIQVPMDDEAQRKVVEERMRSEQFHRPTTRPSGEPVASPTTQPMLDTQLQRAIDTMLLTTILQPQNPAPPATFPATRPTTSPR
ncbi:MAG: S41 family peptidase, partial [Tepidisphaeraceae bacterium]